jgi:hypothetical protein
MTNTAGDADRFAAAHAALKADPSVQFGFTSPPPPPQAPLWLKAFVDWLGKVLEPVGKFLRWIGSFPLFNKDRLRVGDLVAGTWVVSLPKVRLAPDLVSATAVSRRTLSNAALSLYGIYELQTLEEVLRNEQPDAIATVANAIRHKAGLPDDGDDYGFLSDYYAALCAKLERGLLIGRRRGSKWEA